MTNLFRWMVILLTAPPMLPAGRAEQSVRLLNEDMLYGEPVRFEGVDLHWRPRGQEQILRIPGAYIHHVTFPEADAGVKGSARVVWGNGDELLTEILGLEDQALALRFLDGSTRHSSLEGIREIRFAPEEADLMFAAGLRAQDWSMRPANAAPQSSGQGLEERMDGLWFSPRQLGRLDFPALEGPFVIEMDLLHPEGAPYSYSLRLFQPPESDRNQNAGYMISLSPQRVMVSEILERTQRRFPLATPEPAAEHPTHLRLRLHFQPEEGEARLFWNGQDLGSWELAPSMRERIQAGSRMTFQTIQTEATVSSFQILRWRGGGNGRRPDTSETHPFAVIPRHEAPFAARWTGFAGGELQFETPEGETMRFRPGQLEKIHHQSGREGFFFRGARDVRITHRSSRSQLTFALTGWEDGVLQASHAAWTEPLPLPLRWVDRLDFNIHRFGGVSDPHPPRPRNLTHRNR